MQFDQLFFDMRFPYPFFSFPKLKKSRYLHYITNSVHGGEKREDMIYIDWFNLKYLKGQVHCQHFIWKCQTFLECSSVVSKNDIFCKFLVWRGGWGLTWSCGSWSPLLCDDANGISGLMCSAAAGGTHAGKQSCGVPEIGSLFIFPSL